MTVNTETLSQTAAASAAVVELQPNLFFYGRCEEALQFYKDVFRGSYELMRWKDGPAACSEGPIPNGELIMHATFTAPGVRFMASDGRETKTIDPEAGNIALALHVTESVEGDRIFDALSAGGSVTLPLQPMFWGERFGIVIDRFGTEWMMSTV
jgi:PhnB protein